MDKKSQNFAYSLVVVKKLTKNFVFGVIPNTKAQALIHEDFDLKLLM